MCNNLLLQTKFIVRIFLRLLRKISFTGFILCMTIISTGKHVNSKWFILEPIISTPNHISGKGVVVRPKSRKAKVEFTQPRLCSNFNNIDNSTNKVDLYSANTERKTIWKEKVVNATTFDGNNHK